MNPPRFSVIIPTYNNASTLPSAIQSVLDQSWPAHEIIVVDDASTDDTAAVLKVFGERVRYQRQSHNQGVSAARNLGARLAGGDWLAFLDADDRYLPERLRAHAEWIQEDPLLDFLTSDYEYRDDRDHFISRSMDQHKAGRQLLEKAMGNTRVIMEGGDFEAFVADHFGDTHTLSLPRDTFLALGGYPLGFKVCEDVHLLSRLVARSQRAGVICTPLAVYRIHGNSATRRDPVQAQRENVRTLEDLAGVIDDFPTPVRRGFWQRMLQARYNLGTALIRAGLRGAAIRAVLPSLYENPGWRSLRNVLSILKG